MFKSFNLSPLLMNGDQFILSSIFYHSSFFKKFSCSFVNCFKSFLREILVHSLGKMKQSLKWVVFKEKRFLVAGSEFFSHSKKFTCIIKEYKEKVKNIRKYHSIMKQRFKSVKQFNSRRDFPIPHAHPHWFPWVVDNIIPSHV